MSKRFQKNDGQGTWLAGIERDHLDSITMLRIYSPNA
jgi:hypothetical protein